MDRTAIVIEESGDSLKKLSDIIKTDFNVINCSDPKAAMRLIEEHLHKDAVVLMSLTTAASDGLRILKAVHKKKWNELLPVLVVCNKTDSQTQLMCFEYGVYDYIQKPFEKTVVMQRIKNATNYYAYMKSLEYQLASQNVILREQNERLNKMNEDVIELLGSVVEARNLENGMHIRRVKAYTKILATKMMLLFPELGLDQQLIDLYTAASPLHDIGKIMITDDVLLKPGRFTKDEYEYMKSHTTLGCEILHYAEDIWSEEYNKACYDIARSHHERWDGAGYPDGLVGDEIPLSAQLVSIADVYDALVNERPYKKPFPQDVAFNMILNGECGSFSPRLLKAFVEARSELEACSSRSTYSAITTM